MFMLYHLITQLLNFILKYKVIFIIIILILILLIAVLTGTMLLIAVLTSTIMLAENIDSIIDLDLLSSDEDITGNNKAKKIIKSVLILGSLVIVTFIAYKTIIYVYWYYSYGGPPFTSVENNTFLYGYALEKAIIYKTYLAYITCGYLGEVDTYEIVSVILPNSNPGDYIRGYHIINQQGFMSRVIREIYILETVTKTHTFKLEWSPLPFSADFKYNQQLFSSVIEKAVKNYYFAKNS